MSGRADFVHDLDYPTIMSAEGSERRNLPHILETLQDILKIDEKHHPRSDQQRRCILEIASGTGTHVVGYAKTFQGIDWQPTERTEVQARSIDKSVDEASERDMNVSLDNILPAVQLDISRSHDWKALQKSIKKPYLGVIINNLLHCSPINTPDLIFSHLITPLLDAPHAFVAIYGAFLADDGSYRSSGDEEFDIRLKKTDTSFGLRQIPHISKSAQKNGFVLKEQREMPSGNWWLVYRRVEMKLGKHAAMNVMPFML